MLRVDDPDMRLVESVAPTLAKGLPERPRRAPGRTRDIDDDIIGAHRLGGDQRTVDEEVRPLLRHEPVLRREGFSFGCVHNDHRRPPLEREPAYTPPLAVRREPCAAMTAQAAALDDIQKPLAADRSPAQSLSVLGQRLRTGVECFPASRRGAPAARSTWSGGASGGVKTAVAVILGVPR